MGTKRLGNDHMLWIESATPGTYNLIAGQGNVAITRNSSTVDTTSKDDGKYGSGAPGIATLAVTLAVIPKLPDTNGWTRLETLSNASPQLPFNIQIRKNGAAAVTGDAVFQCSVYGNIDGTDFNQNAPVSGKVNLIAAAAPTVDALA
jgi:hypothetical protein